MTEQPFWKTKKLEEMTPAEWEALCDGCSRCCLYKLQDEDTGELFYTNVVCRFMDEDTCRCSVYFERRELMPTCLTLNPALIRELNWMPETCAYRLLSEGKDLPAWHPLVSGNPETVFDAGVSVRYKTIREADVDMDNLEDYII